MKNNLEEFQRKFKDILSKYATEQIIQSNKKSVPNDKIQKGLDNLDLFEEFKKTLEKNFYEFRDSLSQQLAMNSKFCEKIPAIEKGLEFKRNYKKNLFLNRKFFF